MTTLFQSPGSAVVIRNGSRDQEAGPSVSAALPLPLPPLPLVHFRFRARMNRPFQLPDYAGSPLRGIFGHALRATACRCVDDGHAPDCLFASCFVRPAGSPGDAVFPYVILPPLEGGRRLDAGDTFSFEFVVTGATARRAGEYVAAWHHALGAWLGDQNGHAVLDKVELLLPEQAWPPRLSVVPGRDLQHPVWRLPPLAPHGGELMLHFDTPLRIHREGRPLTAAELDARTLCLSLLRRLQGVFGQDWLREPEVSRLLAALGSVSLTGNDLSWQELARYSSRQERTVKLGGLTGTVRLEGNLTDWLPLWVLGQVVHVGKNTTLGFGHYRILQSAAS